MRVAIEPEGQPPIVLIDGSDNNAWSLNGELCVLLPEPDGLEGWRESPAPKIDDPAEMPEQDGAFWPEKVFLTRRILTIRGVHGSGWLPGSSELASTAFRDRLAALTGVPLKITVEDQAGPREVSGYIGAQGVLTRLDDLNTDFSLIVTCPDPLKYGQASHHSGPGLVAVENAGTGDVAVVLSTHSQVTRLRVELNGLQVEWVGNADGLVLDLADGVPRDSHGVETGTLVWADLLRVPPGTHRLNVESDANVTVTIRPGWK